LFINWQAVHRRTPDAIWLVGEYAPIPLIANFPLASYACKQAEIIFPVLHNFKQFIKILFYRFQNFLMLSFHISDDFFINPAIGMW